jgi:hypothetical protein
MGHRFMPEEPTFHAPGVAAARAPSYNVRCWTRNPNGTGFFAVSAIGCLAVYSSRYKMRFGTYE